MLKLDFSLLRDGLAFFSVYLTKKGICLYKKIRNFIRRPSRAISRGFYKVEYLLKVVYRRLNGDIIIIIIVMVSQNKNLRSQLV